MNEYVAGTFFGNLKFRGIVIKEEGVWENRNHAYFDELLSNFLLCTNWQEIQKLEIGRGRLLLLKNISLFQECAFFNTSLTNKAYPI